MKSPYFLLPCLLVCAACVTSTSSLPEKTEERRPDTVEQLVEQLFRRHNGAEGMDGSSGARGRAVIEVPSAYRPLAEPAERLKRYCAEGNGVFSRTGGPQATAESTALSEGASAQDAGRLRAVDRSGAFGRFICVREDVPVWTASIEPLSYTGIGSRAGGRADAGARMAGGAPDADGDQGRPIYDANGNPSNGGVDPLNDQEQPQNVPPVDAPACEGDGTTPCNAAMMRVAVTAQSAPVAGF